ncbi:Alpha/Beta hydrolase protein [Mycena polygramma]|nr:Alpha/Beta hydrolase protein [Mycena polygramma]
MSLCKDCIKGVVHEGTPAGKMEKIGGTESYVATPTVDYPKDKVVLYLSDAMGVTLVNNQLLADSFAANGFKRDPQFDIPAWVARHGPGETRPIINAVIKALQEEGVKHFAAVGYCFGGRYVFDLAFDNIISVSAVAHPSLLQAPADLEKYLAQSKAPLLINSCSDDPQFPKEAVGHADRILAGFAPGYKREHFEGCSHGFAVRGNLSDPKVQEGKEGAFKATVEWFKKYL